MKTIYVAEDGREFENKEWCEDWEWCIQHSKTIDEINIAKNKLSGQISSLKRHLLPICFNDYCNRKQYLSSAIKNFKNSHTEDKVRYWEVCVNAQTRALNFAKTELEEVRHDLTRLRRKMKWLHVKSLFHKGLLFTREQVFGSQDEEYEEFTYCKIGDKVHCKPYASLDIDMDGTVVDVSNCYVRIRLETPNNPKYANSVIRIPLYYVEKYITVLK
jgi:hypothetical protein